MKLLLISDQEDAYLWDYYKPGRLNGVDLILSCGDLKPEYLSFLVTMGRAPVMYVRGNHDGVYSKRPPEGCECIEDRLVTFNGLRILGLGGSPVYSGGPNQYSERQMQRRIFRAGLPIALAGGVDILLSHAPARGWGDADDYAHRGFECFNGFIDRFRPRYHIHGHVHLSYGANLPRVLQRGETTVINACSKDYLEL